MPQGPLIERMEEMYDTSGAIGVRDAVKPHRPPAAVSCRCSSPAILATRLPQRCASACIRQRDGRAHCMRIPYSLTAAVQVTDYSNPAGGAFYFMPSEEVLDRLC
jgi:hypothetical protein